MKKNNIITLNRIKSQNMMMPKYILDIKNLIPYSLKELTVLNNLSYDDRLQIFMEYNIMIQFISEYILEKS